MQQFLGIKNRLTVLTSTWDLPTQDWLPPTSSIVCQGSFFQFETKWLSSCWVEESQIRTHRTIEAMTSARFTASTIHQRNDNETTCRCEATDGCPANLVFLLAMKAVLTYGPRCGFPWRDWVNKNDGSFKKEEKNTWSLINRAQPNNIGLYRFLQIILTWYDLIQTNSPTANQDYMSQILRGGVMTHNKAYELRRNIISYHIKS